MGKKFTYEEVKEFVENNSDCKLLSTEYTGVDDKLKFQCGCKNKNTFYTSFYKFKSRNKRQCNVCSSKNMSEKMSFNYEYVKSYIDNNSKCKLLSTEYKNNNTKMLFECGCEDRNTFKTTFSEFKYNNKRQCNKCGNKRTPKWSNKNIIKKLKELEPNYKFLKSFLVNKSYQKQLWVTLKCDKKHHEPYDVWWNAFLSEGRRCKRCYCEDNNITSWNKDKVILFYEKHGYELLTYDSEWESVDGNLSCKKDDYFYYVSISNIKSNNKKNLTHSLFKNNIHAIKNIKVFCEKERPEYEIISKEYKGMKEVHTFKYNGIGLKENISPYFETTIDLFYHGKVQHPILNKTKMEEISENFLFKHNIDFIPQWTEHNCINPKTNTRLRFDIGILNDNDEVYKILELDGESHYMEIEVWGGKKGLEDRRYRDSIKDNYCKNNNIQLIRIPYTQFNNIEQILTDKLL